MLGPVYCVDGECVSGVTVADIGGESVRQKLLPSFRQSREAGLVAMRDLIAEMLDGDVAPRDVASLTKRLDDVSQEIERLSGGGEAGAVDVSDKAFRPEAV